MSSRATKHGGRTTRRAAGLLRVCGLFLLVGGLLLGPAPARAAPGDLDPTFGDGGVVLTTAFARLEARAHDVVVLGDGKLLAAGAAQNGPTQNDFLLVRLNADGSPDASFGSGGAVLTDFGNRSDEARALAVQPDGKIVLAGSTNDGQHSLFALARFHADGSLDTAFGAGGKVVAAQLGGGYFDRANDVVVQPNGAIVVAGIVSNTDGTSDFVVARLEPDGDLDVSFQGGIVKTTFDTGRQGAEALALQGDKIVAVGERTVIGSTSDDRQFVAARYLSSGLLDTAFDGDGWALVTFPAPPGPDWTGGAGGLKAVALQGDKLVVGAPLSRLDDNGFTYNFGLARLTDGGALDPAFGTGGRVITDFSGQYDLLYDLAVQADGKIVAAGSMEWGGFLVARYLPDGALDAAFGGGDGWATTNLEGSDGDEGALALAPGGKVVLAGRAGDVGGTTRVALARFDGGGAPDPSFGGDGVVALRAGVGLSTGAAHALQVLSDGKIVAAGTAQRMDSDFAALRYGPDGAPDASFGAGGVAFADFAGMYDVGEATAVLPDGRVLMAGFAEIPNGYDFALARFTADGAPDPSFGGDGAVTTDFAGGTDWAYAVALLPGGKFLVAGYAERATATGNDADFALARYKADGSLDAGFGSGGKVLTDFAGQADVAYALALQPDGKIVLAGSATAGLTAEGYPRFDFALARYKPDGTLDAKFDGDGKLTTDFGGNDDVANDVAVLPDGAIVAAGRGGTYSPISFALARYKPNGALDPAFDGDGKVQTDFAASGASGAEAHALVALPGGGLIAGGSVSGSPTVTGSAFALARYTSAGALDPAFGSGGTVVTPQGDYSSIEDLALQPDGKLLAAGAAAWPWPGPGDYVALARYETGAAPASTPGFVMGGGWAGVEQGKLHFHLRARYRAGQSAPTGGVEFRIEKKLYFHGTDLEQLAMSGAQATVRGTGLLDRQPGRFEATVTDARLTPEHGDRDALHLRLWNAQGALVFDGGATLGGGSLVIQAKGGGQAAAVEEGDGDWFFLPWVGNGQ